MKKCYLLCLLLAAATAASSLPLSAAGWVLPVRITQEDGKPGQYGPQKGDWSFGLVFNAGADGLKMQPDHGEFAGDYILSTANAAKQMFILSQDPVAAFRLRYVMSDKWMFRVQLGVNGSHINYREYVDDDLAKALDPDARDQVADEVISNLNSASLAVGWERHIGQGPLHFVAAFGLSWSVAGGALHFNYGNALTPDNRIPTSMPLTTQAKSAEDKSTLNDFTPDLGIAYGRPLDRYNVGYIHGFGLHAEMGAEWFVSSRVSVGFAMSLVPVTFVLQPQTWTKYEGFSSKTGKVERYNDLVSPGSHALLYGTEDIGFNFSLNYFF